jgi:hypothetical protein
LFDYQLLKLVEIAGWYDEFKTKTENYIISILSKSIYKNLDEDDIFHVFQLFSFFPETRES